MADVTQEAGTRRAAAASERAITLRSDAIVVESKLRAQVSSNDTLLTYDLLEEAADLIQKLREALP